MTGARASVGDFVRRHSLALRIAVLVGAAALVAYKIDLNALHTALHPSSWAFVGAAVAANAASVLFKGLAWKGVVDGLPGMSRRARMRDLVSPLFVGFLFNTILAARLGEIVKVMLARRRLAARGDSVRTTMLLGSVVVENIISTIALVVMVILVGIFMPLSRTIWIATAILGIVCLTVLTVALLRKPRRGMPPWLSTGTLWARASRAFVRLWGAVHESHMSLRHPGRLAMVLVPSFLSWAAQLAGIWLALRAFGIDIVGWGGAGLLLVSVTIAQIFPILPGNVGVFQAAVVVPLTHGYAISGATALAFAFGLQATEVVVGVVIGFLFLLSEGVSFRDLRTEAEAEAAAGPHDAAHLPAYGDEQERTAVRVRPDAG